MEKSKSGGYTIWYLLGGGIILYLLFGKNLFAQGGGGSGGVNSILQKVSVLGTPMYSRISKISDLSDVPILFVQAAMQPRSDLIINFGWRCSRVGNQIINDVGIAGTYIGVTIGFSPTITFDYTGLASNRFVQNFGFLNMFKFEASKVN